MENFRTRRHYGVKSKHTCLVLDSHTKFKTIDYTDPLEIDLSSLEKICVGKMELYDKVRPLSPYLNFSEINGCTHYKVVKCTRGILQLNGNEIGFMFKTGSYFWWRFQTTQDAVVAWQAFMKKNTKGAAYLVETDYEMMLKELQVGSLVRINPDIKAKLSIDDTPWNCTSLSTFDRKVKFKEVEIGLSSAYFHIHAILDEEQHCILAPVPDVNQFRALGVDGCPYASICPPMILTPADFVILNDYDGPLDYSNVVKDYETF